MPADGMRMEDGWSEGRTEEKAEKDKQKREMGEAEERRVCGGFVVKMGEGRRQERKKREGGIEDKGSGDEVRESLRSRGCE